MWLPIPGSSLLSPSPRLSLDASPLPLQLRHHPWRSPSGLSLIPLSSSLSHPDPSLLFPCLLSLILSLHHSRDPHPSTHLPPPFLFMHLLGRLRGGRNLWLWLLGSSGADVAWVIGEYSNDDTLWLGTMVSGQF